MIEFIELLLNMRGSAEGRLRGTGHSQYIAINEVPKRHQRFLAEPHKCLPGFSVKPIGVEIDTPLLAGIDAR